MRNGDGSVSRYKACLVEKGFIVPKSGYSLNFNTSQFSSTIKIILTLALAPILQIHLLDVNNVFLQGSFQKQVCMSRPLGVKDSQQPDYVGKHYKAMYGLLHDAMKKFTVAYGFRTSKIYPSLFNYTTGNIIAYFLVYVDDLLHTRNNTTTFLLVLNNVI